MPFKKKDKSEELKIDKIGDSVENEELRESPGNKIAMIVMTVAIILIWIALFIAFVKSDVGGFGSTVLRPLIKDVPYINMILPKPDVIEDNTGYQFESIDDAVDRIKELEEQLNASLGNTSDYETKIKELETQIESLQKYKEEQASFEEIKEKFYEEVVFGNSAIDLDSYKEYYESIDPENAEVLYKQVVEQLEYDSTVKDYAKTYSTMKAKEAAAIFDTMKDDFDLVADILQNMSTKTRADILGKMEPENAAKLTAIMEPKE